MTARHRWFAYFLLGRSPLATETADIDAAFRWMGRSWHWLVLGYAGILIVAIWPAFVGEFGVHYRVIALAGTHLLLLGIASVIAICWIGFRTPPWTWTWRKVVTASFLAPLCASVAYLIVSDPIWDQALRSWLRNTFGSIGWFLAAVFGIYAVELVARLRQREDNAVTRALQAEASSEQLARKTAESELRLLQAQVEPHFLYNTLANLRYLIQKNSPDALKMTDALIEYLRTSVPDMRAQQVKLGREIDHARHYLEIMRMRLGGRLDFAIDVPESLRAIEVPPLVLLTLVENAIKHGIAPRVEGGAVGVRARDDGEGIVIEVADTGAGLPSAREAPTKGDASTHAGLENAKGRLWLTYGDSAELTLAANVPRGTVATVRIPRTIETTGSSAGRVLVMSKEQWRRAKPDPGRAAAPISSDAPSVTR
jgi:signal transduction histidine kinase